MHNPISRRNFLQTTAAATVAAGWATQQPAACAAAEEVTHNLRFGLVTYMWGADWDLPTLITNCKQTNVLGVELRTTHAHKVEPTLNEAERNEVRKRFADAGVTMVGIGSNERYDNPDPAVVKKAIEATKDFIRLSHDIGGTGVKVKPDTLHKNVPREQTIAQIGKALNELGEYAEGFGQQIRLEVHGGCAELPTIKEIMDIATNENVAVCWNSNPTDLTGQGLEHNFGLVRKRFGETVHIHELADPKYPYPKLFELLLSTKYSGWLLLEAGGKPADRIAALKEQRALFQKLCQRG